MLLQMAHSKIPVSSSAKFLFAVSRAFCRAFHIWPLGEMYLAVSLTFGLRQNPWLMAMMIFPVVTVSFPP
jgi:hypothetical protein